MSKTWHGHCTRMTCTTCAQPGATANMAQENSAGRWSAVDPGLVDPQNQPVTSTKLILYLYNRFIYEYWVLFAA